MHTTMVPEQVKTMKIQAGIQVSRPRELTRQLQLWKRFGRLYLIVFVLVRNIVRCNPDGENMGTSKPDANSFTKMLADIDSELEHTRDRLVDKCSQAKYMQDGIQNATVSGGVQVVKYTFIELNQDLFQPDNVVDAEDYTYLLDKLQQGNEDVVFGNIDQENNDGVFGNKDQDVDEEMKSHLYMF
ncbi:hypothetical protein Tco_1019880 [Tanacetum coccineum]|uniref:Uncharacterized protein n=1 Tax=Tanacetum coccineum TaxID=301880 RepID=A0ABQ5FZV4_9ASTR